MKANYDIDNQSLVCVPKTVSKCPYCGDELSIVGVDEWSTGEDGAIVPEHIELECNSQPEYSEDADFSIIRWFERTHSDMPYVRWLPVEEKVMTWFKNQYNFVRPAHEKELLAKWIEACAGSSK